MVRGLTVAGDDRAKRELYLYIKNDYEFYSEHFWPLVKSLKHLLDTRSGLHPISDWSHLAIKDFTDMARLAVRKYKRRFPSDGPKSFPESTIKAIGEELSDEFFHQYKNGAI